MCEEHEFIEENDINAILREIGETMTRLSPEERAYKVVKSFFQTEEPSDKIHTMFIEWMLSPVNGNAKQLAMERVFTECLDGTLGLENSKKRRKNL